MVDALGGYRSRGSKRTLSQKEIKEMREQMQKVPLIQQKSDSFHQEQSQEAESLLQKELTAPATGVIVEGQEQQETLIPKSTVWSRIRHRILDKVL